VSLTTALPRILQGAAPALAVSQLAQFGVRGSETIGASFESEYAAASDPLLSGTSKEAFEAMKMLKAVDPARYQPANGAEYPRGAFGGALRQIAQLARADVGLEVAFAEVGGWDTHVSQGAAQGQLAARLDDFAQAIAALVADLGDRMEDTVVITMSEFGRAVNENGNRGTDHGHGSVSFVMGGPVRGGRVYGRWPGLRGGDLYEGRDLAVTTDFRDLLAEVLTRHRGERDLAAVFPGHPTGPRSFPGVLSA
jgi:uncharacterized protein (DUF1501 family)